MTDLQDINYNMLVDTYKTMLKYKTVWIDNQNIVVCVDKLGASIKLLKTYNSKKRKGTKDMTLTKTELRVVLTKEAFVIKQALVIYYQINNLTEEMELLSFSKSAMGRLTSDSLYLMCINILNQAIMFADMLVPIGISQAKIDKLATDIEEFGILKPQLELAKKKRSTLIKLIDTKIKESLFMLRKMLDISVSVYEEINAEFVASYKASRHKIQKPGKHKTYLVTIIGMVTDSITKQPLEGIMLIVGKKLKPCTTDIKGIYKIKLYKKDADFLKFNGSELYFDKLVAISDKSVKNVVTLNVELDEKKKLIVNKDMKINKTLIDE